MQYIFTIGISILFIAWLWWYIRRITKSLVDLAMTEKNTSAYEEMNEILRRLQHHNNELHRYIAETEVNLQEKIWELKQTVNVLIEKDLQNTKNLQK